MLHDPGPSTDDVKSGVTLEVKDLIRSGEIQGLLHIDLWNSSSIRRSRIIWLMQHVPQWWNGWTKDWQMATCTRTHGVLL